MLWNMTQRYLNGRESYILMGVSGSGKSLIGSKIATLFSAKFIDGDDLHPAKNIDKMSQGIPLTDEDRLPWLERLNDASYSLYKKNETGFIVCSSLKKQYRDILRKSSPNVHFLWLDGRLRHHSAANAASCRAFYAARPAAKSV
ncbi:D-gluconate kinase [Salmonella enterica subsp. diarizonae]|uniref:Gluconokinase n=1 Tax=Salmonella diarizonae TaxID=59204 RepID=A0A379U5R6_SALDZ|nr:D-gluconate kinase [Salmonella enterica subsp. diarizonae]